MTPDKKQKIKKQKNKNKTKIKTKMGNKNAQKWGQINISPHSPKKWSQINLSPRSRPFHQVTRKDSIAISRSAA